MDSGIARKPADEIQFPLRMLWDDGSVSEYKDLVHLQLNLEDWDSELEPECHLTDAKGRRISAKLSMTAIERLELDLKG